MVKLVDKLVDECTENVEEVKLAKITSTELHLAENVCKCSFCTLYIVLISILFTIIAVIGSYWLVIKKKMLLLLRLVPALKQQFNELINAKNQTN